MGFACGRQKFFSKSLKKRVLMNSETKKLDKEQMKRFNRQLIFREIHRNGSISRSQLAKLTGLTPMSVGRIADELISMGVVTESDQPELHLDGKGARTVGRKPKLLYLVPEKMLNLGMELDRDRMRAGVLDINGKLFLCVETKKDLAELSPETVAKLAAQLIGRLRKKLGNMLQTELEPFVALSVVCPGIVDSKRGIIRFSSQLRWENVDFAQMLRNSTKIPNIRIDNEVKSRGQAEAVFGAGQKYKRVALLNIGSGLGSCLVLQRQVYRGKENIAGEIGHICVEPGGKLCECGRRGCLQTRLSDLALLEEMKTTGHEGTIEELFAAYDKGEQWAVEIIKGTARYAVLALEMIRNLYAPNVTVLCGRLVEDYPQFYQAIVEEYISQQANQFNSMELTLSTLGADGNLIGAGASALEMNFEAKG